MIGIITTLSTQGTTAYNPVDSQVELEASKEYVFNTDNITRMKVYGTTDSELAYKLDRYEDRSPEFKVIVNETNAAIQTIADTAAASNVVTLNVFLNDYTEDALSFAECAALSTTAKYYNIESIVWGFENDDATITCLYIAEGGWGVKKIFVDSNLDQIIDLVTTGTTTTTTSSTSTTTTSA